MDDSHDIGVMKSRLSLVMFALGVWILVLPNASSMEPITAYGSVLTQATATPIPTCPPDGDGGLVRCYAKRHQVFPTPRAKGVSANLIGYITPCIPYDWATGFSFHPVWIDGKFATSGDGTGLSPGVRPWVEFGVMVRGSESGGICISDRERAVLYSYCGNCYTPGVVDPPGSHSYNGYEWHGPASEAGDDDFFLYYMESVPSVEMGGAIVDRWVWKVNGVTERVAENPTMGMGSRIGFGSETTHWDIDTGRVSFEKIWNREGEVGLGGVITVKLRPWKPTEKADELGFHDGDHKGKRYWNFYRGLGESILVYLGSGYGWKRLRGPLIWVNSDDGMPPNSTRCDYSGCPTPWIPKPLHPTVTPTP